MTSQEISDVLKKKFGAKIAKVELDGLDPWIEVTPDAIVDVCLYCRDQVVLAFDYMKDLSAIDWLVADEKKAKKLAVEPHLEVVYRLFSFTHKHDLNLKVVVDRWKGGVAGELPEIPSVSSVWKIAEWHEREIYDLMGVHFTNHPALRRILCPEDWVGHPLRKDYEFPLEYHGIRCK